MIGEPTPKAWTQEDDALRDGFAEIALRALLRDDRRFILAEAELSGETPAKVSADMAYEMADAMMLRRVRRT